MEISDLVPSGSANAEGVFVGPVCCRIQLGSQGCMELLGYFTGRLSKVLNKVLPIFFNTLPNLGFYIHSFSLPTVAMAIRLLRAPPL